MDEEIVIWIRQSYCLQTLNAFDKSYCQELHGSKGIF